tara:strand:+ start:1276 stop:1614 length:339 start_codon:yes stop_codon:yes gene_type:complete
MKHIKEVLSKVKEVIAKNQKSKNIWVSRSKQNDNGKWVNEPSSIDALLQDKSDDYFYNAWCKLTEDSPNDINKFIETELIPNDLWILEDTQTLSKDEGSVRFMIARPRVTDS